MASLRRKVTRRAQPQGSAQIDWSNPITKGLVAAINPAAPDPQLIRVGSPTYVPTPYGVALKNPNDTTVNGLSKTISPLGSAATIVAYCTIPEDATTAFLVAGFASNAYPSPFGAIFAFQGSLPSVGAGGLARVVIRTVDGSGDLSTADAGTYQAIWGTVPAVWVAIYDGTSNLTLYRNGKDITASRNNTAASGALSTIDNFSLGFLNRATNNSSGPNTQNLLGMAFNRALSPSEIYALSKNPWQIFKSTKLLISTGATVGTITRPNSDIAVSGWTSSDGAPLYDGIDEVTASDVDYIISPELTSTAVGATFGLTTSLTAGIYDINIRARRTQTTGQIRVVLKDAGGTSVGASNWQTLTNSPVSYVLRVSTTGTATQSTIEAKL